MAANIISAQVIMKPDCVLEMECGVLLPGRKADILVTDREFTLLSVLKSGRTITE